MSTPDIISIIVPAKYQYLGVVGSCVRAVVRQVDTLCATQSCAVSTVDENLLYQIELSLHEICSNIIKHAYGEKDGQIRIAFTVNAETAKVQIDLYDDGLTFNSTSATPPNLERPQTEGYGLFLAQQLLDTVLYERQGDQNHWYLVKSW